MKFDNAKRIADKYKLLLQPYCAKIEIAGSIRRKKSECKDIEIVCIPKYYIAPEGMFGTRKRVPDFVAIVNSFQKIIGDPENGRYCRRLLPEGIVLDLFITEEENFGNILTVRTGPASFSQRLMEHGKEKGYVFENGRVIRGAKPLAIPEEKLFFKLLGIEYIQPEHRI